MNRVYFLIFSFFCIQILSAQCEVDVEPVVTNNYCNDGTWILYVDFDYEDPIPDLDGVTAVFESSSGLIINPSIATGVTFNSDYDLAYIINEPDTYFVSFAGSGSCSLLPFQISFVPPEEINVNTSIESPVCNDGSLGLFSGNIDGPVGIYEIYIDNVLTDAISLGLENLDFDAFIGNATTDCNGNTSTTIANQSIAITDFSDLLIGDQIGAFFIHPTCGLSNAGSVTYELDLLGNIPTSIGLAVYGDDIATSETEGFSLGEEILYLVYRPSTGEIFVAEITWLISSALGLTSGDFFEDLTLSATASLSISEETFESESFSIDLPVGEYTYSIVDGYCEIESGILEIIAPPSIEDDAVVSIVDNECPTVEGGVISVNGLNSSIQYTVSLLSLTTASPVSGNNYTFEDLPASQYFLSIENENCPGETIFSNVYEVTAPDSFSFISSESNYNGYGVSCYGASDAFVTVDVTGGTGDYSYAWSNGSTSANLNNVAAGTYFLIVTDDNGCFASPGPIVITESEEFVLTPTISNYNNYGVSCNGASDGSIDIQVSGGVPPYEYEWSNGETSQSLSNIGAGSYSVTVTDDNGCLSPELDVLIIEPQPISVIADITEIPCFGGAGDIVLSWSGGTPFATGSPYQFIFPTGVDPDGTGGPNGTEISIANSAVGPTGEIGYFAEEAIDANGCSFLFEIYMTEPDELITSIGSITEPLCNGDFGSVDLIVGGGNPPYDIEDLSGLSAASYTTMVTDDSGCETSLEFTIEEPDELIINIDTASDVLCNGESNGIVNFLVTGGVEPYTYNNETSLSAGSYTGIVVDGNGCEATIDYSVSEPDPLNVTFALTDASCNGEEDGVASLSITGGTPPYSNITNELFDLAAGTYSETLIDDAGCSFNFEYTIEEPEVLTAIVDVTNVSCSGGSDGSAELTVSGGTPPYIIDDLSSLSVGSYSTTIFDDAGCDILATFIIEGADLIEIDYLFSDYNGFGVNSNGGSDGSIELIVSGGAGNYTYVWSNGETTQNISNLVAGEYSCIITDELGCEVTTELFTITEPDPISIDFIFTDIILSSVNNGGLEVEAFLSCNAPTGSIEVIVTGGVIPYTFSWYEEINGIQFPIGTPPTANSLTDLGEGIYCVTVTDINGSSSENICFIIGPSVLFVEDALLVQPPCSTVGGSVELLIDPLYESSELTYQWSNGDATLEVVNLDPGLYSVIISDGSCSQTLEYEILEGDDVEITWQENSDFNGYEIDCFGSDNADMLLIFDGGQPPFDLGLYIDGVGPFVVVDNITSPYTFSFDDEDLVNFYESTGSLEADYQFVIFAADGVCSVTGDIFEYTQPDLLEVNSESISDCYDVLNVPDGQITLTISGGVEPYFIQYSSDNGVNDIGSGTNNVPVVFNDLAPGIYDFEIEDENGCVLYLSEEVLNNGEIDISWDGSLYNCSNNIDAYINILVTGGTPPYTYQWIDTELNVVNAVSNDGIIEFNSLLNGDYFFSVSDSGGCNPSSFFGTPTIDQLFPFTVNQIEAIDIDYDITQPLICYDDTASYVDFSIQQTGDFTSSTFNVYVDSSGVIIDSLIITPESLDLDFCFPTTGPGNSSIIASTAPTNGELPFFTNMDDGDVFGFFNLVNPSLNSSGYQCVGGIQGGVSGCSTDFNFIAPQPYGPFAFNGPNLSFIVWYEDALDLNSMGVLNISNPNFISNEIESFVNRNGVIYGCEVQFSSTPGFISDLYVENSLMYIESIIVDDEPFLGDNGDVEICIVNPSFNDDYTMIFIDQFGCETSIEFSFPAPQEAMNIDVEVINELSCVGVDDASVGVTISGGYGDYDILLFDNLNQPLGPPIQALGCPTFSQGCDLIAFPVNLGPGDYYVFAADSLGCEVLSDNFTIEPADVITVNQTTIDYNLDGVFDTSCYGEEDGGVYLNIEGGSGNYNIEITIPNGNVVNPVFNNTNYELLDLGPGFYFITIEDVYSNQCIVDAIPPFEIIEPDPILLSYILSDYNGFNISCNEEDDGFIDLNVAGGAGGYTYAWSNGSIEEDINNLSAGIYSVTVEDQNGCSEELEVNLTESSPIELVGALDMYVTDYNGFSTSCAAANDGQIGVDVPFDIVGGIGDYEYNWFLVLSSGVNQSLTPTLFGSEEMSLDGVSAGNYLLEVVDENNCILTLEFNLTQPDNVGMSLSDLVDYNNDGVEDNWPQNITIDNITNELSIYGNYGISCYGSDNGFIDINIQGGTGEYTYLWTTMDGSDLSGQEAEEDLYNLIAGTYTVTVTDDNFLFNNDTNCYTTQTFILTEPTAEVDADVFIKNFSSSTNFEWIQYESGDTLEYGVSCYGESDGEINIGLVSGGTGLYSYKLSTVEGDFISQSGLLEDLSSGTAGSGYSIEGLSPGTYMLFITDSNYNFLSDGWVEIDFDDDDYESCVFKLMVIITSPNEIEVFSLPGEVSNYDYPDYNGYGVSCNGASDGFIQIHASGGEGLGLKFNYTYQWSAVDYDGVPIDLNGQDNVSNLSSIPAGIYNIVVTDSRQCSHTGTIFLTEPDPIDFTFSQPTDSPDVCFDISCYGESDGWIQTFPDYPDAGLGYTYQWSYNGQPLNQADGSISNLSPGYYQLSVQDNLTQCENSFGPFFISEPHPLYSDISNVFISDFNGDLVDNDYNGYSVSCPFSSDGSIGVKIEGGSGLYNVVFLDDLGAIVGEVDSVLIPQPCEVDLLVSLDIDGDGILNQDDQDVDGDGVYDEFGNCISNCNLTAIYDIDGNCLSGCEDNDPLPYYPGEMSTVVELSGLPVGIYSVIISDGSCSPLGTINDIELIAPPNVLEAQILQVDSVSCTGLSDGSVLAEFFGGLPNNWNWALYSTTEEGMSDSFNPSVDILIDFSVNLFETGEIFVDDLSTGFYRLDVYDINGFYVTDENLSNLGLSAPLEYLYFNQGCSVSLPIEIHEPPIIEFINASLTHPCFNDSSGVISFDLLGHNPPYQLYLNDVYSGLYSESVNLFNLSPGSYTVSVLDVNNCTANFNFDLGFGYATEINMSTEFFINNIDGDGDGVYDHIEMPDCEFSFNGSITLPEVLNNNNPNFSFSYFWEVDLDFDQQYDYISYDQSLEDLPVGIYSLNVIDNDYNCVIVYDYELEEQWTCPEIPTGFSPNGDGINDYWILGGLEQYVDAEVSIYNRWGDLVFYAPDNKIYWDGRSNGKDMPIADYFYIIHDSDGVNLSHGRVTLRR